MSELKATDIEESKKLHGKANYITWKRDFDNSARTQDVLSLLEETEPLLDEPKEDDYITKEEKRKTRTAETSDLSSSDLTRTMIKWQADYKRWEQNQVKLRRAASLLDAWVSEGVRIDIEAETNAIKKYKCDQESLQDVRRKS